MKIYDPPYRNSPAVTIEDAGEYPVDVPVSRKGMFAIINFARTSNGGTGGGDVKFFAAGSTKPCRVVVGPRDFQVLLFGAFDRRLTLFVGGETKSGTMRLAEIFGGCEAKVFTQLTTTNQIGMPGGIKVDPNDNILVADQGGQDIDVYAHPPSTQIHSLGAPTAVIPLNGIQVPVGIALNDTATDVYVADARGNDYEYAYPGGGSPIATMKQSGEPVGIALTPAERPLPLDNEDLP